MKAAGKVGLIVANGDLPGSEILSTLLSVGPYILAADGGADKLLSVGTVPDAVLGDFDSLAANLPSSVQRIPAPDQNYTDLDKAVNHLIRLGFETIWLTGATGNRLDHTYGALSVLLKYGRGVQLALIDSVGAACPVDGTITLDTEIGQTISLLALGETSPIVTAGLRWNLTGERLCPGIRDGISNEAVSGTVSVTAAPGSLIVYVHHV